jgi:inhibitor of KinA
MKWAPLGDNGVLVWCANERAAASLGAAVRGVNWPWLVDVVQAYASVAVFFDGAEKHAAVFGELQRLPANGPAPTDVMRHTIPVCYEKHLDLDRIATHTGLDHEAIIERHVQTAYTVYAIGFCPGYPFLGYLPAEIANVPRLPTPRVRLPAGSVGLTGRQTGIYTEVRPGGWNIVGQTPLELVNVADNYFPLRTGDEVRFERIDEAGFAKLAGQRLRVLRSD